MSKRPSYLALATATLFFLNLASGFAAEDLKIVDHLMDENKVSRERGEAKVETIMLHFCSDVIQNPKSPYSLERIVGIFDQYGVSAHYLIDREGVVHRLVKEERAAFHAGKGVLPWPPYRTNVLNNFSIGIEIMAIGSREEMKKFMSTDIYDKVESKDIGFTEAQYASLKKLIAEIRTRWPLIEFDRRHIVGHDTYAPDRRSDPGELFDWTKIGLPATKVKPPEAKSSTEPTADGK